MQARYTIPLLALTFMLCAPAAAALTGGPPCTPRRPPQEYRQETNAADNPGSIFAASEQDTLFFRQSRPPRGRPGGGQTGGKHQSPEQG